MKRVWKKIGIAALGAVLCFGASFLAMVPASRSTEAAVAVFDQKNIEEAIKTAIQTANILTAEEKQLLLMILNNKKLDVNQILVFAQQHTKQKDQVWDEKMGKIGTLKPNTSVQSVWTERIGDIEGIINGNITVWDGILSERKRQKMLHDTNLDAAKTAAKAQDKNIETVEAVKEIMDTPVEGTVQAIQVNTAMTAQGVYQEVNQTALLNSLIAIETTKNQKEIVEEAEQTTIRQNSIRSFEHWSNNVSPEDLGSLILTVMH